jgi:transposase
MMGNHDPQEQLFSYQVNLERRLRPNHPLRRFAAVLDLNWVRDEVKECYGRNGNVSVDPVVLVKMMLLLFLDDISSERELMAIIAERLDYLWFLGYRLDDAIPNHSVLSKARARWGTELFEKIFIRTVSQCLAAGLIDGSKLHIDSSLVRADAARDSVITDTPEVIAALRAAYQKQAVKLEEEERPPKSVNATHVSTTDPEATLARGGNSPRSELAYKHHRVVDDAKGVITAIQTTTGETGDAKALAPLVDQHQQHTKLAVGTLVGDKHYGSAANYRFCQVRGIQSHLGRAAAHLEAKGVLPVSAFRYEAETDCYRCPQGHHLHYHNFKKEDQLVEYRISDKTLCARCPLRPQCTRSQSGRSVSRPIFAELVQAGMAQAQSEEAKRDRRRRKHLMEGSFADAANNHGFKRARWRGLWRQSIQDWLIAAVQNLRLLLRHTMPKAGAPARSHGWLRFVAALARAANLIPKSLLQTLKRQPEHHPSRPRFLSCIFPARSQCCIWATRPNVGGYLLNRLVSGRRWD